MKYYYIMYYDNQTEYTKEETRFWDLIETDELKTTLCKNVGEIEGRLVKRDSSMPKIESSGRRWSISVYDFKLYAKRLTQKDYFLLCI